MHLKSVREAFICLRNCLLLLCFVGMTSCNEQAPETKQKSKGDVVFNKLPPDCSCAIDSFITNARMRTEPDNAIKEFNRLAAKYEGKDTLSYATMRIYCAQAWDVIGNGDSMIDACQDGMNYFDDQLPYLDMRVMGNLYTAWGYFYKKNMLTANYFFSLTGNDLIDTVYVPSTGKSITAHFPTATKAALLQEIADMASMSNLYEQARRYNALSRQYLERIPQPDPYLQATIYLGAAGIYLDSKMYDSVSLFLNMVPEGRISIADPELQQLYLRHKAAYFLQTGQYDSSIKMSLQFQATIAKDTSVDDKRTVDLQQLTLVQAYAASGQSHKASLVLQEIEKKIKKDTANILEDGRISYLRAQVTNLVAGFAGTKGYKLLNEFVDAKDNLYDQQRLASITDMDARYSIHRKEDAIRRLNIDNEEYARRTRRQNKLLIIAVLSILLIVATGIIFYQRQARRRLQENVDRMELEQRLLRTQIEPHFMFNTLAVLQGLIRREEKEKSIKYLNQFARLLRISLEHARESFVPLRGELEAMKHYLGLQQVRFQEAFTYTIETWEEYEDESDDLLLPPMLLQPFAENAVQHGIKSLTDGSGRIRIIIEREDKAIRCIIEDNGAGFDPDQLVPEPGKKSLATLITKERLAILSKQTGQMSGLTITSRPGEGTRVSLLIPYIYKSHQSAS